MGTTRAAGARRRRLAVVAANLGMLAVSLGLPAAAAVTAPSEPGSASPADAGAEMLLVRFKDKVAGAPARAALDRAGVEAGRAVGRTGFVEVGTGGRPPEEVGRELLASGLVEVVEPNRTRRATLVPDDPHYADHQAAYLSAVNLPRAWDSVTGSNELVLAVIDSGVDRGHPDLAGRLLAGRDVVNRDSDPSDDEGHGTMVSGIAGAVTDNGVGVAGVAWGGRILPIKVLDDNGVALDNDIAAGITWAVDQGADVINLSLGGPGASTVLQAAVDYATAHDVVVVAAAGNLGSRDPVEPHYPAACDGVIAVGATDAEGNLASFSNYGSWLDLVAPGVEVTTTIPRWAAPPGRAYATVAGTSFSAPLVAGAALLLRAANPAAPVATIVDHLRRSARDLGPAGFDVRFGAGLLDVAAALRSFSAAGSDGGTGTQVRSGYWALSADGRVYDFGDAAHFDDAAGHLSQPAADIEPTPGGAGYWVVDRHGAVFTFGTAGYHGGLSLARLRLGETVTSLSATPDGGGYWLFTTLGRVFAFGSAAWHGDMDGVALNGPVLDSAATPGGGGYYMVGSDGGIFAFGDARFIGSMGGQPLNAPVQSLVPDPDGAGYWLVASDGGVFAFDARFWGSMGGKPLNRPVTGMVAYGNGYLMVAEDGGIFNFSDLSFEGSLGDLTLLSPVVAVAPLPE